MLLFQALRNRIFGRTVHKPDAPMSPEVALGMRLYDARQSGWFRMERRELVEGFQINPTDVVVDVGCGDGSNSAFCGQCGAEVIATDIDPEKVALANQRLAASGARKFNAVVSDSNPLPVADSTATRVIAMEVLEHVDDPKQFVSELVRIGKPGALYFIMVPDVLGETVNKSIAPESYWRVPNHVRVFQHQEFDSLIENAGLKIESHVRHTFYWSMWWFLFWACDQEFGQPEVPLLDSWSKTWDLLISTPRGLRVKEALDRAMPKSYGVVARKVV